MRITCMVHILRMDGVAMWRLTNATGAVPVPTRRKP